MIRNYWKKLNYRNIIGILICLSICLLGFSSALAQSGKMVNVPHSKTAEKHLTNGNWDGTYDLTIGVNSVYHDRTDIRFLNILFLCDLSSSMDNFRQNHADAVLELITALEGNNQLDIAYSMIGFAGTRNNGLYADAILMSDWGELDTDQKMYDFSNQILNDYSDQIGGLTNYQAAFIKGNEQLNNIPDTRKNDAETIIIFMTDGEPNFHYDENGQSEYLSDYQARVYTAYHKALPEAAKLQADYFFGVFFGTDWPSLDNPPRTRLQILSDMLNAANVKIERTSYHAQNAEELLENLKNIAARLETVEPYWVTIEDTLHDFAEFAEADAHLTLQVFDENKNIVAESIPDDLETSVTFTDNGETITMKASRTDKHVEITFEPETYFLHHNYTFQLTMHVKPSAEAYTYYNQNHSFPHTGDGNTGVHSWEQGFYANEEAFIKFWYIDPETREEYNVTLDYLKPVLQIEIPAEPEEPFTFYTFDTWRPLPELPRTGFSALHPTLQSSQPKDLNYSSTGMTLQIPSLDVSTSIVTVPAYDGNYPVDWLGERAGLFEGSAKPGEGYSLLTGHNHLNTMEAGSFALLKFLTEGDRIIVLDEHGEMKIFAVYASEKISADNFSALENIAGRYENSLTLLTCEDERPEGGYASRRVISARPL